MRHLDLFETAQTQRIGDLPARTNVQHSEPRLSDFKYTKSPYRDRSRCFAYLRVPLILITKSSIFFPALN